MNSLKLFLFSLAYFGVSLGTFAQNTIEIKDAADKVVSEALHGEVLTIKIYFKNTLKKDITELNTAFSFDKQDARLAQVDETSIERSDNLQAASDKRVEHDIPSNTINFWHRGITIAKSELNGTKDSTAWIKFKIKLNKLATDAANCNITYPVLANHKANSTQVDTLSATPSSLTVNKTEDGDDEVEICEGSVINLKAPKEKMNYLWSTGEITESITIKVPGEYPVDMIHPITVCTSTHVFKVKNECFAIIPSVITPNNDGHNDKLEATLKNVESFEIVIFNQSGHTAYTYQNSEPIQEHPVQLWDGKIGSKEALEGVYFYKVKAVTAGKHTLLKSGNITLLR